MPKYSDFISCVDCGKENMHTMSPRCAHCRDKYSKLRAKKNRERYKYHLTPAGKYSAYRTKAHQRGIPFELSHEEFSSMWEKPCTYCGDKIDTIGIDRKDSLLGYTVGNSVPCCKHCNYMKNTMTHSHFIERCLKIARNTLTE
jgi:hypothetical protein